MIVSETTAVTFRLTNEPSRSKQAGPCWISVSGVYASTADKSIDAEIGSVLAVTGKATLRRATRNSEQRGVWWIRVTGKAEDTVTVSLGSPESQALVVVITGVQESTEPGAS